MLTLNTEYNAHKCKLLKIRDTVFWNTLYRKFLANLTCNWRQCHSHWLWQLWGTGARVPPSTSNYL